MRTMRSRESPSACSWAWRNARAAEGADRPNLVLIIADDMAWNDCGAYGHPNIRTPNIDALARSGMRFDRAFLTTSSCSPSRSSIITGRYPHSTDAEELHWPLPAEQVTFVEKLKGDGYWTAAAGKWHLGNAVKNRFNVVHEANPAGFQLPTGADADQARLAFQGSGAARSGCDQWVPTLRERPKDKPFFLWLAALDPHRDYEEGTIPEPHRPEDAVIPPYLPDTPDVRKDLALYYDEIARLDHFVGEVLKELDRQGVADQTLVLFISDNGRPFPRCKTTIYDSGVKTPWIVRWPGHVEAGSHCERLVSSVDIAPTFLTLAGIQPGPTIQGKNFAPLLTDPEKGIRDHAFSERNWHDYAAHARSARSERYRYIRNFDNQFPLTPPADAVRSLTFQAMRRLRDAGKLSPEQTTCFIQPRPAEELYDNERDPYELHNLANDPEYAEVLQQMRQVLTDWQRETDDRPPKTLSPDEFDRETGKPLPNRERPRPSKKDAMPRRSFARINCVNCPVWVAGVSSARPRCDGLVPGSRGRDPSHPTPLEEGARCHVARSAVSAQRVFVTPTWRHIDSKRAGRAFRRCAPRADELAERDEPLVDLDPVPLGQLFPERGHRLFGGGRRHVAPAVRDPVDMHIDGDRRTTESDRQGQRRDLRPDAPEGRQPFQGVGNLPTVLLNDPPRQDEDVPRLRLGERGPPEQGDQLRLVEPGHPLRRPCPLEQPQANRHRRLVAGPGRDQAADQLLERRAVPPVAQVEHRRLGPVRHGGAEAAERLVDVERLLAARARFRLAVHEFARFSDGPETSPGNLDSVVLQPEDLREDIELFPEGSAVRPERVMMDDQERHVVLRRQAAAVPIHRPQEVRADLARVARVKAPRQRQQPLLPERTVEAVRRLGEGIRVEEHDVVSIERHLELSIRRLVIEAQGQIARLTVALIEEVPVPGGVRNRIGRGWPALQSASARVEVR